MLLVGVTKCRECRWFGLPAPTRKASKTAWTAGRHVQRPGRRRPETRKTTSGAGSPIDAPAAPVTQHPCPLPRASTADDLWFSTLSLAIATTIDHPDARDRHDLSCSPVRRLASRSGRAQGQQNASAVPLSRLQDGSSNHHSIRVVRCPLFLQCSLLRDG